jgi:hypothetical protein
MPTIEEINAAVDRDIYRSSFDADQAAEPGSKADLERFFKKVGCTEEHALTSKHLEWGWKDLDKRDGAALAHVIRNNQTCITLDLFVNEIYEAGVLVGHALKDNTRLKTIDLQQGQIGVEGGRAIADALRVNGTLMNLKLCTPPYADRTRGTRLRLTHARFPPPWRQTTTV